MPPRLPPAALLRCQRLCSPPQVPQHTYATSAVATALSQLAATTPYPPTQPPSHKPAHFRKSQLLRQYTSLLQSTPLMLLFQHNNLTATEWVGIRRELQVAISRVDKELAATGSTQPPLGTAVKLQIVQTGLLSTALRLLEHYNPAASASGLSHILSSEAHAAIAKKKKHPLTPLMAGPVALLTFPTVSPLHLKAALSVLSPSPPQFPIPSKKVQPGWHELNIQLGLQKLMLLGARVEDKVFDVDGTRWVGSIGGGLDGLRATLVAMLQGMGASLTTTLDGAGRSVYFTLEGRKMMLEEETETKN